ncbi:hypothetical protein [Flavobacterium granuli]|uniref:Beta-glucosidase n=1 Tax=Flavobacterium granuli TaxID=280093 RepID=A0ABU1S200_9FLAO|nr:hypothetical protein [Flavobacterium granuli]MDR6844680.1 hypothetical protein [Flavobacterium granuli]
MKNILFFSILCILLTEYLQAQKKVSNPSYEKTVNDLLSKMTLAEKVHILHGDHLYSFPGIERLDIVRETKMVEIQLSARDFSYWSVEEK